MKKNQECNGWDQVLREGLEHGKNDEGIVGIDDQMMPEEKKQHEQLLALGQFHPI